MSGSDDRESRAYAKVDEALRTYPLPKAPSSIFPAVMARVDRASRQPRFHLTWLDCALGLLGAVMLGLVIGLLSLVPAEEVELSRIEMLLYLQHLDPAVVWPVVLGCFVIVAIAVAFAPSCFGSSARRVARSR